MKEAWRMPLKNIRQCRAVIGIRLHWIVSIEEIFFGVDILAEILQIISLHGFLTI